MNYQTYTEPSSTLKVYDVCDVLVVGSGAAGHSAAIAAARAGCKNVILMERYGYSGGNVTGGFVLMVPKLSWYGQSYVRGLQEEWFTRLKAIPDAYAGPGLDEIGDTDPAKIEAWSGIHGCVSESEPKRLVRCLYYEPNQLKIEMDKMLIEHRDSIRVLYHSWGTKPILEDGQVKGVIFESKEGRQVVLAKVVIDATGDGDLFRQTGTEYRRLADSHCRCSTTALVWRIGGVDHEQFCEWKKNHPEAFKAMRDRANQIAGFRTSPFPQSPTSIYWVNNWHPDRDCGTIKDCTETEMNTRATIREVLAYYKEVCPVAFRNAYLYDIAPQLGTRCSSRLQGEHVITVNDFAFARQFDDVIAWHSTICLINDCAPVEIPYRSIVPKGVDNLLCPGRHISADDVAIDWVNLIPQCIGTGQAAGVAAAVAVADGTTARTVDIKKVQNILIDQDVPLPRNERVDKALTECCEEHEYGLYTDMAKKAHAEAGALKDYRQGGDNRKK